MSSSEIISLKSLNIDQRQTHIWLFSFFRCRKLIIFTRMLFLSIWKLYQRKEWSLVISVLLVIPWIVFGIVKKKNNEKNITIFLLYTQDFIKSLATVINKTYSNYSRVQISLFYFDFDWYWYISWRLYYGFNSVREIL